MSYVTVVDAQLYFDKRLNTAAWDTSDEQLKALENATLIIDRLAFKGSRTEESQDNEFPRDGDTTVPTEIQYATAEIALALLDGVDPEIEYSNLNMLSQSYSNVRSSYDRSIPQPHILAGIPSAAAWRLLLPYLVTADTISLYRI